MNTEIWETVPNYENYMVSNLGRVKSLNYGRTKKEQILKPALINSGYLTICLYKNKIGKRKTIHQLVAEVFLNHKPCGYILVVNHKDHNKLNNHLGNLEVITNRENTSKRITDSRSKYVGVHFRKNRNSWVARIMIGNYRKYLGSYKTELEAHFAYQKELLSLS